jgi:hypothetical protein
LLSAAFGRGVEKKTENHSVYFIQPELMLGKAVPASSSFPDTRLHMVYALNAGRYVFDQGKNWSTFYNYPFVGVHLSKSSFGHDEILGTAYTIMPFIELNTSKKLRNSFHIKLGLGTSYFTESYHKEENPMNNAIGSRITWTFQSSVHYTLLLTRHFTFNIGGAYVHHSNGHTQLPNLGLNSFLFSASTSFFLDPLDDIQMEAYQKPPRSKSKQTFIEMSAGLGMHEMGGPNTIIERLKKTVASVSASGGIIFNRQIKFKAGFIYRFYHHYYSYIKEFDQEEYQDYPVYNSSNLIIFTGVEFLLGHVGMDAEVGINIFKPFYKEHSNSFENDTGLSYSMKRLFASRLGLKVYAISTEKNPPINAFIGAHINANMGQADFSSLSIGIVKRFLKKSKGRF